MKIHFLAHVVGIRGAADTLNETVKMQKEQVEGGGEGFSIS